MLSYKGDIMTRTERDDFLEKELPMLPANKNQHNAVAYVNLVYEGTPKIEAFEQVFPERVRKVREKAHRDRRNPNNAIMHDINNYENGKFVTELYRLSRDSYWVNFIDKRTQVLNKMANLAMDDSIDLNHQFSAAKIFLSSVPDVKKEEKVVHEHRLADDDTFKRQLKERQKQLFELATTPEEIIDAEITNEGD